MFKDFDKNNSEVRTIDAGYIDFIKYADGKIERFVKSEPKPLNIQNGNDASKEYLEIQYEKYLARATVHSKMEKAAKSSFYIWLVTGGILSATIDGFMSDDVMVAAWLGGSAFFLTTWIVESSIKNSAQRKVNHYKSRLNDVSLKIAPYYKPQIASHNFSDHSLGISLRLTF